MDKSRVGSNKNTVVADVMMTTTNKRERKEIMGAKTLGFSLLETLLLLLVFGVVLQVAMPRFKPDVDRVRNEVQAANIERIESAAQIYRIDVGVYPARLEDLMEPPSGVSGWQGPYLDFFPQNPFDATQPYQIDSLGQVR